MALSSSVYEVSASVLNTNTPILSRLQAGLAFLNGFFFQPSAILPLDRLGVSFLELGFPALRVVHPAHTFVERFLPLGGRE